MLIKGIDSGFDDVDVKQGIVSGVFAKHNVKDLGGDISEDGVFKKSFEERGPKGSNLIKFCLNHEKKGLPGVLTELWSNYDKAGYVAKAGKHNAGIDFVKMVDSGIINQHSYGYIPVNEKYDHSRKANILKEVKLLEVSAIEFLGMNPETTEIELKDFHSVEDALKYMSKLEKFLKVSDCTDDTLIKIDNYLKSLQNIVKPLINTSVVNEADQIQSLIDILKN